MPIKNIVNPKSANLKIVNTTVGVLNVIPSEIPWLNTGIPFRELSQFKNFSNGKAAISKRKENGKKTKPNLIPSQNYQAEFFDEKKVAIRFFIIIGILWVIGSLMKKN